MAFTRKMLKALGIEDDKIETIIEEHAAVTDALKQERDGYKADAEKLPGVQRELDELKAKPDDGYKEKYEAEKTAHDKLKTDIANEKAYSEKEAAYRELLKGAGIKEKFIDTIVRAEKNVIDGLKLNEGKVDDADTLTANAKRNWSDFVATNMVRTASVENPPANNGGSTKTREQIFAIKDTAARQAEMYKNPELFGIKFSE